MRHCGLIFGCGRLNLEVHYGGGKEVETIAVYWEERVRIYGTTIQCDLTLVQFDCTGPGQRQSGWLKGLSGMAKRFYLYNGQCHSNGLRICLLLAADCALKVQDYLAECEKKSQTSNVQTCKAELLSFHGPHFQDRYGIAHSAIKTLADGDVPVLASGCTGTTIHLVFSQGLARVAAECLSHNFYVPRPEDQ